MAETRTTCEPAIVETFNEIRVAEPGDLVTIAALEAECFDSGWTVAALQAELERPEASLWVVGRPVLGHLLAWRVLDEAEVITTAVSPKARRQGLGTALMDHLIVTGQRTGLRVVHLEVRADNRPACALYNGFGFREVGRRRAYYRDGSDALLLAWSAHPLR